MKIIQSITDKEILGTEGLSHALPRYTARAIVRNADGLYALMYAQKFSLYSLPGGGIEPGESPEEALRRELLEETGCICREIRPLGTVYENRFHADYTQYSDYFFVLTEGAASEPALTDGEKASNTSVQWRTLQEVERLISEPVHTTNQRKFLQARDVAALTYYGSIGGYGL